jgi:hypothetical protein
MTNLPDSDSIIENFFELCYNAGTEKCAFYSKDGVKEMRQTFFDFLHDIQDTPISVNQTGKFGPSMITLTDVMFAVRTAVYSPRGWFPTLARLLKELSKGDISEAIRLKHDVLLPDACPPLSCQGAEWLPSCYNNKLVGISVPIHYRGTEK